MTRKKSGFLPVCGVLLLIGTALLPTGCATNNKWLLKLPGFTARTDHIPGLITPQERAKAIRLKGEKGSTATDRERDLLLGQLLREYQESPDPNIRRETIDAIAKIPHNNRIAALKEGMADTAVGVRRSACMALTVLVGNPECSAADLDEILHVLRKTMREDSDKDVRILAMTSIAPIAARFNTLGDKGRHGEDYRQIVQELGELLEDKVPSVRYQAMVSLKQATGKDYGVDIDKWIAYIDHFNGRADAELPKERTWLEKIPTPKPPMIM